MKFIEELKNNTIKVWEEFYINYLLIIDILFPLKKLYKKREEKLYNKKTIYDKNNSIVDPPPLLEDYNEENLEELKNVSNKFKAQLFLEIQKANFFYEKMFNDINQRFLEIKNQVKYAKAIKQFNLNNETFEIALKEIYKEISMIEFFVKINTEIINKLNDKLNKYLKYENINSKDIMKEINNNFRETEIGKSYTNLPKLKEQINLYFWIIFKSKYHEKTKKILNDYIKRNIITPTQSFYLGLIIGLLIFEIIIIFVIGFKFNLDIDNDPNFKSVFPMFRGFFVICLYWWTYGINVYFWNKYQISYRVILEFDNHYSQVIEIFQYAGFFTFFLLLSVILYMLKRIRVLFLFLQFVPTEALPLVNYIILFGYLFCPFKIFNYKGRKYLIDNMVESLFSFFLKVSFKHTYLITQMTSFVSPLRDLEYTLCYFAYYKYPLTVKNQFCSKNRGIYLLIGFTPFVLRILQCIKTIIDTGKYYPTSWNIAKFSLKLFITTISFFWKNHPTIHIIWLICTIISSIGGFIWDINFAFGLNEKGKGYPLREKIFYNKYYYYIACTVHFFLTFLWILTLSPEVVNSFMRPETFNIIIASLEMLRRGIFNSMRIEYKHVDITNQFKAMNRIELPYKKKNGKYVNNESNILDIMSMSREEKIQYEIQKITQEKKHFVYESRFISDFEEKKKPVKNELNEYLNKYYEETQKIKIE